MSVIKEKRGEAKTQFLDSARELEEYTIKQCRRFPKAFTFIITNDLVRYAKGVYEEVIAANTYFPTDHEEYEARKNHINEALVHLRQLDSQLVVARGVIKHTDKNKKIEDSCWENWGRMINEEYRLLTALKKSDKEQFKKLI